MTLSKLVLSCQPLGPATLVTPTALPIDARAETPRKALRFQLLVKIADMRHNPDKQTEAAQQRYHCGHMLPTKCLKTMLKIGPARLGPYQVRYATLRTVTIDQGRVPRTICADRALMATAHVQLQDYIVDEEYNQLLLEPSVRNPGKSNVRPGQSEDHGSQTQGYTVDHIVKHVGNGH